MKRLALVLSVGYIALAIIANWMASRWVWSVPFTHLAAPAGFVAIGIVLVFRDWIQQLVGLRWSLTLVPIAGALSYLIAEAAGWTSLQRIAIASVIAFVVSESIEAGVFLPIRKRSLTLGVALSATIGNAIDSFLFIWIAWSAISFPGATHWGLFEGNFVGKAEMIVVGVTLTACRRLAFPVAQIA